MKKKVLINEQIDKTREALNNMILKDINNDIKVNRNTLLISYKLDKLITDYINLEEKENYEGV